MRDRIRILELICIYFVFCSRAQNKSKSKNRAATCSTHTQTLTISISIYVTDVIVNCSIAICVYLRVLSSLNSHAMCEFAWAQNSNNNNRMKTSKTINSIIMYDVSHFNIRLYSNVSKVNRVNVSSLFRILCAHIYRYASSVYFCFELATHRMCTWNCECDYDSHSQKMHRCRTGKIWIATRMKERKPTPCMKSMRFIFKRRIYFCSAYSIRLFIIDCTFIQPIAV